MGAGVAQGDVLHDRGRNYHAVFPLTKSSGRALGTLPAFGGEGPVIRYRKLTSSFDTEAYGRIVKQSAQAASRAMERRHPWDPPPEWSEVPMPQDGPITGLFSAPRKVEATEHRGRCRRCWR